MLDASRRNNERSLPVSRQSATHFVFCYNDTKTFRVWLLATKPDTDTFHFQERRLFVTKTQENNLHVTKQHHLVTMTPTHSTNCYSHVLPIQPQTVQRTNSRPASAAHPHQETRQQRRVLSVCARKFRHKKGTETERSFSRRGKRNTVPPVGGNGWQAAQIILH
jgi:hypothetical protein